MQPRRVIHLKAASFGDRFVGLGSQLVKLLQVIESMQPELQWYGGDLEAVPTLSMKQEEPEPTLIGGTRDLVSIAHGVDQFLAGVFAGVIGSAQEPSFRDRGFWTEDDDDADLGDAIVEIRAFDTSYWIIGVAEERLAEAILSRFPPRGG